MSSGNKTNGAPAQRSDKTILSRTFIIMIVCGILAFIILGIKLYSVMIKDHDFYEKSAIEQQTKSSTVEASRGKITDRNGNTLAVSATAYNVFISPHDIKEYDENIDAIADGLARILNVDRESIVEKSKDVKSYYKTIKTKIESDEADKVREFISENDYRSIHIETTSKRYYPYNSLASHVIGFVGTENTGLEGIEAQYDSYLTGTDGSVVRLTASNGTEMLLDSYENYFDAIDGCDLELTLDVTIQAIAEKYLNRAIEDNRAQDGGCCIVMDVNTGEVLAMASSQGYDLNNYLDVSDDVMESISQIVDENEYNEALKQARLKQWRNKAVSDTYEPGSVFKIITMATALEEGVANESSTYYCGGQMEVLGRTIPLKCWKTAGHGEQTLRESAMHSCNVAFVNIGLDIGARRFYDYVEAFGLFDKTGIDLPSGQEASSQWWSDEVFCQSDNLSQLAAASFGQTFNVTPIQMITAVSAVANGGYLLEPYIVKNAFDSDGKAVYSMDRTVVRQVISEQTSRTCCSILESVVGDEGGTGSNAYVPGYRVCGKTGTTTKTTVLAETGEKEYMVSFCGFAPADDPKIAVLVVLDNPVNDGLIYVSGGVMAAPSVGSIISETLPYLGIEPEYTDEEAKLVDRTVPKCTGLTVSDATKKLEEAGFEIKVVGEGDSVTDQLPVASAEVAAGTKVILYAGAEKTSDEVTVPDLSGLNVSDAIERLSYKGLYMNTSGASPANKGVKVSGQSVEAGTAVEAGSVIEVYLKDSSNIGQY